MAQFSDKEMEKHLAAAAKSLARLPPSVDDLLTLLNHIEALLSKVEESPAKPVQNALSRLMKALDVGDLSKHSDVEVKVGVASCISEITRINAPVRVYVRRTRETTVMAAMDILSNVPGIAPGSELWNYACNLIVQNNTREVFVCQPSHESRLSWLEYNYDKYKRN